jgi:hypothetical protein
MMISGFQTGPQSQLFGEWTVWHSHNPSFRGSNKMLVGLYPDSIIEVTYKQYIGPWLIETRKIGEFTFQKDVTHKHKKNNRKRKRPYQHLPPIYKSSNVCVQYSKKYVKILSFLGIGFDDISPLHTQLHDVCLNMSLFIVDKNDLFLTMNNNKDEHYHLIRSIRVNEPSINVPISTLIATNIVGMIMTALIHIHYFKID